MAKNYYSLIIFRNFGSFKRSKKREAKLRVKISEFFRREDSLRVFSMSFWEIKKAIPE